ncbi:MAG: hypothetical protein MJ118_04040 [Clostridia bacterium]|nr:hypothetical protein [Clostridia bacterium]
MRKNLLPQTGKFYKVNLHSHSICSDGSLSPEQIKETYLKKGYSAVAFTEHEMMLDFSDLSDENFIAITAYEYEFISKENHLSGLHDWKKQLWTHEEKVHLNLFSKDPHDTRMICFNPANVWGNAKQYLDRAACVGAPDYDRSFSIERINEVIRAARERDMLVVFNHPNWSLNTRDVYAGLENLSGFEIINGSADLESDMDYAPHVYQELARLGKRMICVGGDDNHKDFECGLAWTMIKADFLSYQNLMDGLEKGNCYASSGPKIYELYVEDRTVTIRCSEAVGIYMYTAGRRIEVKLMENDVPVTDATFKLEKNDFMFRISVRDNKGNHANTRYYYFDEIYEQEELETLVD